MSAEVYVIWLHFCALVYRVEFKLQIIIVCLSIYLNVEIGSRFASRSYFCHKSDWQ